MVPTHQSVPRRERARRIASRIQELKRPSNSTESFHLLNVIRKLEKEFARQSPKQPMPSVFVKAVYMKVALETYRTALETQVDVDKVEPHNLEDQVLAFNRNHTSGTAPMDIGQFAPGQPQVLGVGGSSQGVSSCLNGWAVNYPVLNNYEYGSHWGQDHLSNTGDVDASSGLHGESYGLQKEKGAKGKGGSFDDNCFNCGKPSIRQSSVSQKMVRPKDRHKAKRETVKGGMMERVGHLARDGRMGKVEIIWAKLLGSAQANRNEQFGA